MSTYFAVFGFATLLCFIGLLKHDRRIIHCFLAMLAALFVIFSSMRSETVGADYKSYKNIFYSFDGMGFLQALKSDYFFEPGFAVLVMLLRALFDSHLWFFAAVTTITSVILYSSVARLTPYPLLSFLVFFSYDFFTNYMVAIRFGVVASLALLVLHEVSNRRLKNAFLLIIFGMTIHTAAIGLFIPIFVYLLRLSRAGYFFLYLSSLVLGFIAIGSKVIASVPAWIPRRDSALSYASDEMYGASLGVLGLVNIKYLLLCLLTLILWDRLRKRVEHFDVMIAFLFSSLFLRVGFHDLGFIVGRVSAMVGIVEILIVPLLISSLFGMRLLGFSLVVAYALIHLVFMVYFRGFAPYELILLF